MKKKTPLFEQRHFYIPVALLLGLLGFSPMLVSVLGKKKEETLNSDYYTSPQEPFFKSKE
jgi:hypothetical protein